MEQKQRAKVRVRFNCQQCGKCCSAYSGHLMAKAQDIVRWRKEGRKDILSRVRVLEAQGVVAGGEIWINPRTGRKVRACPFLERNKKTKKARCLIQDTKPLVCRKYPFNGVKVRLDECNGIMLIK